MTGFNSKREAAADKLQEPEREALTLALIALHTKGEHHSRVYEAIAAIQAVLAQPAQKPASYLYTVLNAYGPNESISLDQKAWSKLHSAIKAALAQPAQEPVAYVIGTSFGRFIVEPLNRAMVLPIGMALYSSPQGNT